MPKEILLDRVIENDEEYTTDKRHYWVIKRWGTNENAILEPEVDGQKVGELHHKLSPLSYQDGTVFRPVDLEDRPIVVPPEKTLCMNGSDGNLTRVIGVEGITGGAGELPSRWARRRENQLSKYWAVVTMSKTFSADISAGEQVDIETFEAGLGERYEFKYRARMVDTAPQIDGWRVALAQFYPNGNPLIGKDISRGTAPKQDFGYDFQTFPSSVDNTILERPYGMENRGFVLEEGDKFELKVWALQTLEFGTTAGDLGLQFLVKKTEL